jgi:glycine oxidase
MQVTVVGAGIAGLCCALELAARGAQVELLERGAAPGLQACSWCAGGMLAPWCELEAAGEELIARLGVQSLQWWRARSLPLSLDGTLVIAVGRDRPELQRFAQGTRHYQWVDGPQLKELEPELGSRFDAALWFADEGHVDPRVVLPALLEQLEALGVPVRFGSAVSDAQLTDPNWRAGRWILDCRGYGARSLLPDLRGVRGEALLLQSQEVQLRRPIRLLHPRVPAYLVPRTQGRYLLGATMIESEDCGPVSVRSVLELLSAAYALHPALGEARILEVFSQVRPAFADNLPRVRRAGRLLQVNGLFRHGFLLAPAVAVRVAEWLLEGRGDPELIDEDTAQRRLA